MCFKSLEEQHIMSSGVRNIFSKGGNICISLKDAFKFFHWREGNRNPGPSGHHEHAHRCFHGGGAM